MLISRARYSQALASQQHLFSSFSSIYCFTRKKQELVLDRRSIQEKNSDLYRDIYESKQSKNIVKNRMVGNGIARGENIYHRAKEKEKEQHKTHTT